MSRRYFLWLELINAEYVTCFQDAFAKRAATLNSEELDKLRSDRRQILDEVREERKIRDELRQERLELESHIRKLKQIKDKIDKNIGYVAS